MKKVILYLIIGVTCSSFATAMNEVKLEEGEPKIFKRKKTSPGRSPAFIGDDSEEILSNKDTAYSDQLLQNGDSQSLDDTETLSRKLSLFLQNEDDQPKKLVLSEKNLNPSQLYYPVICALESSPDLIELHLPFNQLKGFAFQFIIGALKQTPKLEVFVLNNNEIGDDGVRCIVDLMAPTYDIRRPFTVKIIASLTKLRILNLANNQITEFGKKQLTGGIFGNINIDLSDQNKKMIA